MRTIVLPLLLLAAMSPAQESAPASRPDSRAVIDRAAMESDLDALAAAIRDQWSYLEDKSKNFGVDLDALMARAKAQLPETGTRAQFHEILAELVAGLKDGHGNVFSPGIRSPSRRWPFAVAEAAEGIVVVRTLDPKSKLPAVGDRVIQVDGTPTETKLAEIERTTLASTPAARRAEAIDRLVWTSSPIVTVGLESPGAPRHWVSVETLASEPPDLVPSRAGPRWELDLAAPGVRRLRVRSFAIEDWRKWLAAKPEERNGLLAETMARIDALFREIAGSEGLILDFRGNGGGTDLLGIHLAKHLLPKRFVYFQLSARHGGKWWPAHKYEHDPLPADQRFDGPLAILIDEGCFSTTDNFLRAVIENRNDVIVVGRPTNGGTGCPVEIAKLPNSDARVTLCTQRVYGPKGTMTEGRGTVPTIAVKWTAADYVEGRDPDVAAALEALRAAESRTKSK